MTTTTAAPLQASTAAADDRPTRPATLAERREAWLQDVGHALHGKSTWQDYAEVFHRVRTEGPAMGRAPRWQRAVAWLTVQLEEERMPLDWVVLQGLILLTHAHD
jgi:hypothetical protein